MARTLGFLAALLWQVGALGGPPAAQAQQANRARLHFEAGASYYEAGDYEDALREFERSFELSGEPALYFNYSLCYQQLGRYAQAADYLERFLEEAETIDNRPNLERRLANLRERAAAAAAAEEAEEVTPPDDDEEVEVEPEPTGRRISPGVYAGFGVAAVGGVMMAVFGPLALAARNDLDADPCSTSRTCDASQLRTRAVLADVGLGLLVVGAALGTTFLFLGGDDDDESEARLELTPSIGRRGAAAVLRGTF